MATVKPKSIVGVVLNNDESFTSQFHDFWYSSVSKEYEFDLAVDCADADSALSSLLNALGRPYDIGAWSCSSTFGIQ